MQNDRLAIGLMSGTSLDGIDASLVRISDNLVSVKTIENYHCPYSKETALKLKEFAGGKCSTAEICAAQVALGQMNGEAVLELLKTAGANSTDVSVIGYHGQTVQHLPDPEQIFDRQVRSTLQLSDAATVAETTGIPVVSNFRAREIAAGGQGAPLVPFFDYHVFRDDAIGRVILNIGGIANVTFLPAGAQEENVIAFDTGPGNSLIDILASEASTGKYHCDVNGEMASRGTIDERLLHKLMQHPYLEKAPPKSTGREEFGWDLAKRNFDTGPAAQWTDLLATATEFTVESITDAIDRFWPGEEKPHEVIASGGGVHNPILMSSLEQKLAEKLNTELKTTYAYGVDPDFKEAIAFAFLADRTMHGLSGNLPAATGAKYSVILGDITLASTKS